MLTRVITLLLTGVVAVCTTLPAQNFSINYQTPDQLAVCANDTLFVTIQNNTASTVSGALLDLELPSGLDYLPGSLSGATESDISKLQKPVLAVPALPPGQALSLRLQLSAGCGLVDAINSSQLFSLLLRVRAGATTEAITTAAFQVQTSLLVITEVENDSVSGVYGDMWIRTIHVQNTRLGPVQHLFLSDLFPDGGFSVQVAGAASEQSLADSYNGRFDGSYFTAFGDGDTLLEFGETVLLREKITITNCGKTMKTSRSDISVGWSCTPNAPVCQIDSAVADVVILEYKNGPELLALGDYPLAWDYCAETPAKGFINLTNYGPKAAQNIFTKINTIPLSPNMGIDPNSLRLWYHGVLTPIPASLMDTLHMPACGKTYASSVSFYVPEIAGHDSAFVYYDAYYCLPGSCEQEAPVLELNFFQFTDCVSQTSASLVVQPQVDDLLADVYFDIGNCLQDDAVYDFKYVLQCERLLGDSGYIWLKLDLPYGLFWSPTCAPVLGGKSPASFSIDSVNTGIPVQRVLLAFELPLNSANVDMPFCLRSTCRDDAAYVPHTGIDGPDAAGNFVLYPSNGADSCGNCGYLVHTAALLTPRLDSDLACAIPNCDTFRLRTECDRMDCGGANVEPPAPCPALREHFSAARTNFGLADNDNNRIADPTGALDLAKIRRDRCIAGDTMQAVLSTKILCGDSLTAFFYQIFTETIQSDVDYAGVNDNFELGPKLTNTARQHLANRDSFQVIGATFMVWDSSANAVYTCPVLPGAGGTNTHFGLITPVNTKPPPAKDQLATMSYVFEPNLSALGAAGCLPAGLMLESGDSVALVVDYKLAFNFVPYSAQHQPPLINFEMSFNANGPEQVYSYRQFDTLMFQYSGVRDSVSHPQFGIKACTISQEIKPFSYTVRLARENLFPYEVRPLNTISDYNLSLPAGLQVNGVRLEFMNLQENFPLLQNLPLPFANSGSALDIDFAGLYQSPPDEGYNLRTHVEFAPNCQFARPQASNQHVLLDWNGCIEMPNPDTIKTGNVVGFLANLPRDTMTTDETEIEFPTPQVAADVFLENKAPIAAPNFWIQFINPGGGLSDFSIVPLSPGGPALTPLNGIVQLGELAPSELKSLRIQALNNTCVPQELWLLYGWDCQPHTQPGQATCSVDTLRLRFIPQNPEIELELLELPDQVPLCDSSEYLVLEISNAELGYAFQPSATLELPAGFQLVPGSCQLAYPKGAAFVNIPDPSVLPGGVRQWDLAQLHPTVGATGLPGVNLKPANALQIRFRLRADCGVVSNAQLVFGARAEWFCGLEANSLRKASAPLPVEGITPTYNAQVTVSELGGSGLSPCGTEHTMAVSIQVSGPALPGDSIYVTLP
ncbi:MAG: DUF11 domain-containing protein, partial [Saprospiraceae bacterium]|nr:DUF11 domain-containing protein [Saprospiraceae bacterium]